MHYIQSVLCVIYQVLHVLYIKYYMCYMHNISSVICAIYKVLFVLYIKCYICYIQSIICVIYKVLYVLYIKYYMHNISSVICAIYKVLYVLYTKYYTYLWLGHKCVFPITERGKWQTQLLLSISLLNGIQTVINKLQNILRKNLMQVCILNIIPLVI